MAADTGKRTPRVIGRYALYDEVAAGGMATVHLGRLLGPVGFARTVAIKRLHAQYSKDPEFVSMFLDEARLAARIRHPNVVQTIDVVALESELFLVMDYVQGDSLARLIHAARRQRLFIPVPYAAAIAAGVLHGLHAAHEARGERGEPLGIVHRDVSPHNVLVGVDGVPRIIDFGVAKAVGRLQTTREGQIKGKLSYMAPEQLRGTGVDRRTDVYAVGVILWEALVGRRLYEGETDPEVYGKVLAGNPQTPRELVPDVPHALDAIVCRALASSKDDRFPTAREMARALETSVPLVAPAEIGEWVEKVAADSLARRADKLRRIEAESSDGVTVAPEPPPSGDAPQTTAVPFALDGDTIIEATQPTQMSSASASKPNVGIPSGTKRLGLLALAAVGVVAVIVLALRIAIQWERPVRDDPSPVPVPAASSESTPTRSAQTAEVLPPIAAASSFVPLAPAPPKAASNEVDATAPRAAPVRQTNPKPPRRYDGVLNSRQ